MCQCSEPAIVLPCRWMSSSSPVSLLNITSPFKKQKKQKQTVLNAVHRYADTALVMWVQLRLTHQDIFHPVLHFALWLQTVAACALNLPKDTLTAQLSVIIWKSFSTGLAVNFWWEGGEFIFATCYRSLDSASNFYCEWKFRAQWAAVSQLCQQEQAKWGGVKTSDCSAFKEHFIVGVLIWGWIYTLVKCLISLWHTSGVFMAVWNHH